MAFKVPKNLCSTIDVQLVNFGILLEFDNLYVAYFSADLGPYFVMLKVKNYKLFQRSLTQMWIWVTAIFTLELNVTSEVPVFLFYQSFSTVNV